MPNAKHTGYYQRHIFFCTNQRDALDARGDCTRLGGAHAAEYVKNHVKQLGIAGAGAVRVNKAGCLDRCASGPVCVVYPDNVWYQYLDERDLDEIISEHLQHGRIVPRLRLED